MHFDGTFHYLNILHVSSNYQLSIISVALL